MGGRNGYTEDVRVLVALSLLGLLAVSAQRAAAMERPHSEISEENYDFLSVTEGPCIPKIGVGIEPKYAAECKRMTEPRRYRGR